MAPAEFDSQVLKLAIDVIGNAGVTTRWQSPSISFKLSVCECGADV